jgi:hypothetical protein
MTRVRSLGNDSGLIYLNLKSGKLFQLINQYNTCTSELRDYIPVLQLLPVYPRSHPPPEHSPVVESHGSLRQWQVSVQLYPNCPGSHATN